MVRNVFGGVGCIPRQLEKQSTTRQKGKVVEGEKQKKRGRRDRPRKVYVWDQVKLNQAASQSASHGRHRATVDRRLHCTLGGAAVTKNDGDGDLQDGSDEPEYGDVRQGGAVPPRLKAFTA